MAVSRTIFFTTFLGLAWLNPFAPGPSTAVTPWLVSLACVGVLALSSSVFKNWRTALPWIDGLSAFSALYFAASLLWQSRSIEALATLIAWGCVAMMALVGATLLQVPARTHFCRVQPLAHLWLGIALLSVLMAICQYLRIEHWFAPWISHSSDGAAFANLRQRNQFATLCGIGLLALLYLLQTGLRKDSVSTSTDASETPVLSCANATVSSAGAPRWQAAWPWLAVTALAIGNGLSSSRTGALQWLLIAALVLCWRASLHRKVLQLGLGALAIYAVVVALMPWFANAVGNSSNGLWGRATENAGSSSRLWLYSNVLELIAQKPWLGWGWRELGYAHYSTHFDKRFGELLDNAHNLPLHLAVELGVPFALLFCGAVLWWIVRSAPWRETDATRQLAWGVLMLIGVHSMVEYPLWYGPFLMTLGLCIGLLQPVERTPVNLMQNKAVAQWNIAGAAIKGVAICMIAFAAYAAYDYHRVSQIYLDAPSRSSRYSGDALGHAQRSVLFQRQARFAELVTTPVTPASAPRVLNLAADLIHFSPEPRVIEALIESATMLHMDDLAMFHLARYKEVYPKEYAAWSALK
jgi:Virulence factor membrane-bound polymerase, C-terminal/O-Antigen ligase/Protein glycosylation ligase